MNDWDKPIGSEGWDVDENGNLVPKTPGTTINQTTYGEPPPTMQAQPSINRGSLITTPDPSTGEPQIKSPYASSWTPEFQPNTQLTPNPRTGAPGMRIRNLPVNPMLTPGSLSIGGPLLTGAGLIANAPRSPQETVASADKIGGFFDSLPGIKQLIEAGYLSPSTLSAPAPITQTGFLPQQRGGAVPPVDTPPPVPPPPGLPPPPGPFVRGPLPPPSPNWAQAPSTQRGRGGPAGSSPAPPAPSMVDLQPAGHWQATAGNARGNPTWVPGQFGSPANPAPQLFRGWTTAQGAPLQGQGPRGAQSYYTQGSAPVATGDWTGTGQVPGPLAAIPNAGGNARGGVRTPSSAVTPSVNTGVPSFVTGNPPGTGTWTHNVDGTWTHTPSTASPTQVARAPTIQRAPFSNSRFFGNPANLQYPNAQM